MKLLDGSSRDRIQWVTGVQILMNDSDRDGHAHVNTRLYTNTGIFKLIHSRRSPTNRTHTLCDILSLHRKSVRFVSYFNKWPAIGLFLALGYPHDHRSSSLIDQIHFMFDLALLTFTTELSD